MAELVDRYGRVHTYLRVSVTDRCNYRCVYCMPPEGMSWVPRDELLSYEEIARIVSVFAKLGIKQVRITGGEPTMRSDICRLFNALGKIHDLEDLTMTTNAHTLAHLAKPLAEAGLGRVNISMDSLREDRFRKMTRGGSLKRVLKGINAARESGLTPIKINTVLLKGTNDDEIIDLIQWCATFEGDLELRFIEYMPFQARWHDCVTAREVKERISSFTQMVPAKESTGRGPSRDWYLPNLGIRIGFISPLSNKFCGDCNRLRLQNDGHLRTCLAHENTPSLRDLIRNGATNNDLIEAIKIMVMGKPEGHQCTVEAGNPFEGIMTGIGG